MAGGMGKATRRQFVVGGGAVATLCCAGRCAAGSEPLRLGRPLCASAEGGEFTIASYQHTTGDKSLDRLLAQELNQLATAFGLHPDFYLYEGAEANAMAVQEPLLPHGSRHGVVLFQLGLMVQLLRNAWGGAIVAGILAHEFGHIHQFSNPQIDSALKGPTSRLFELHADFLAGIYMGRKLAARTSLDTFIEQLFRYGDYDTQDPNHHGTPEQRRRSVKAGIRLYEAGRGDNMMSAAREGVTFVKSI